MRTCTLLQTRGTVWGESWASRSTEPGALHRCPGWGSTRALVPESLSSLSSLSNVLLEDETLEAEQLSRHSPPSFLPLLLTQGGFRPCRASSGSQGLRLLHLARLPPAGASSWPASSATCPTSAYRSASVQAQAPPALAGGDNSGDYSEDGNFEAMLSERERPDVRGRKNLKVALRLHTWLFNQTLWERGWRLAFMSQAA